MSSSRKKISLEQMPLFSVTEKLRQNSHKGEFKRQCCQKENCCSKDSKHSKNRDQSISIKKSKKKKYLEQEVEKLIQKRYANDASKINQIKVNNSSELVELRGDLREMKDVINKLSTEDWYNKKDSQDQPVNKQEYELMYVSLHKKIDELRVEMEEQKERNAKLEEEHVQSQLCIKQTQESSQAIIRELTEFTSKHVNCEQNIKVIEEMTQIVKEKETYISEISKKLSDCMAERKNFEEVKKEEMNKIKEENVTFHNQNRKLLEEQKQFEKTIENLNQLNKRFGEELFSVKKNTEDLEQKSQDLLNEKQRIQKQLKKLQKEYNATKVNLGNTQTKLKGLNSMQKKCQELYQEIKRERDRWDDFNFEANTEKETLQQEIKTICSEKNNLVNKIEEIEKQMRESKEEINRLKVENQRVFNDKVKLSKQINNLQSKYDRLIQEKYLAAQEKENLTQKMAQFESILKEKEQYWRNENKKLEKKMQWLEKEKSQIESQVKGTLEVAKKRNDEIVVQNSCYRKKISSLEEEIKTIKIQMKQIVNQTQGYKRVIGVKEQKIVDLEMKIDQTQTTINTILEKKKAVEDKERSANIEWHNKYESINFKLDSCLAQLKDSKDVAQRLESELSMKEEEIINLSSIKEELESRLSVTESRFNNSQSERLCLSSQLQLYQSTSRRNQEILKEQKTHYEGEILKKNNIINNLKDKIKIVKEESFKIQEQMQEFRKQSQLEELFESQLVSIQNSIKYLTRQKDELQLQLNILKAQNNQLNNKVFMLQEKQKNDSKQQENIDKINILQHENASLMTQLKEKEQHFTQYQEKIMSTSQINEKEVNQLKCQLESIKNIHSERAFQTETSINLSNKNTQMLLADLKAKDEIIAELNQKVKLWEDKKRKVVNEIRQIQNQIAELTLRNNLLEQDNKKFEEEIEQNRETISHLIEKNKLLVEGKAALQQQSAALSEQSTMIQEQLTKMKQMSKMNEEESHQNINEVYSMCEARKNEAVGQLKQKINELATELSSCINKLNSKNSEIEACQAKYVKLQNILEENHSLLTEQRTKREKLSIQVESGKYEVSSKEREIETLSRDKTILRQKVSQNESKYSNLKRKFDYLHQQKTQIDRELQNQSVTIRILKQQNKNIEKVMTDQINQRKIIIEQLVCEKRMLYSQLNH